jgi:hypothetical protein
MVRAREEWQGKLHLWLSSSFYVFQMPPEDIPKALFDRFGGSSAWISQRLLETHPASRRPQDDQISAAATTRPTLGQGNDLEMSILEKYNCAILRCRNENLGLRPGTRPRYSNPLRIEMRFVCAEFAVN